MLGASAQAVHDAQQRGELSQEVRGLLNHNAQTLLGLPSVQKAEEMLKADPKVTGKEINVDWKVDGHRGNRSISVAGVQVFVQSPGDYQGTFLGEFIHLELP